MVTQPGPKNPNWGGGRAITSHGYRLIKVPRSHHLANANGYAYEHRMVAEEVLGRRLQDGEWVTFRNGDKTDCSPANLVVHQRKSPEEVRAEKIKRATIRKRGIAPVPSDGKAALLEFFEGRCAYCGAEASCFDHVDPVASGGNTAPGNIVPACGLCNGSKHSRNVWDWADETARPLPPRTIEFLVDHGHHEGAFREGAGVKE